MTRETQKRVLIIGNEEEVLNFFASSLGTLDEVHVVSSKPLATGGICPPASLNRVEQSYEVASRMSKPYVCVCVSPEDLKENKLPLHMLCDHLNINHLIVANRSSIIENISAKGVPNNTLTNTQVEDYLAKSLVEWDYVAQTLPSNVSFDSQLNDSCGVTFVDYDYLIEDPINAISHVSQFLGCSMDGFHTRNTPDVVPTKHVTTSLLSEENKMLTISIRNILLYRVESSEEDQSSVGVLMSDNDLDANETAGSGSDIEKSSLPLSEFGCLRFEPQESYISTLKNVATNEFFSPFQTQTTNMKRRHPMHSDSIASIGQTNYTSLPLSHPVPESVAITPIPEEKAESSNANSNAAKLKMLGFFALNVFFFHCLEAYLKEKIFHVPNFHYVEILTVMQSVIVGFLALLDCHKLRKELAKDNPKAPKQQGFLASILASKSETPLWVYLLLGFLIASSQYLTNRSILHLDYVTQVVFKSSKLLWVMSARVCFLRSKKRPSLIEWIGGVFIVAGLLTLSINTLDGKKKGSKGLHGEDSSFSQVIGLICITIALFCDASIYIVEEALAFGTYHASKQEVILFMQLMAIIPSSFFLLGSGKVYESFSFVFNNPILLGLVIGCYACSYMGTKNILALVEGFDGTVAALVTSMRKIVTIVLSFIFFPKELTINYIIGAILIIAGANASIMKRFGGKNSN